ncbi:MAG: CrcB family protein, partial [Tetrasphaera sp.]|nr:CrcB family protein [Tetrasphaera sp.]
RRTGGFVTTALLVALGAAVGAAGRHLTNHWLRERFGATPAGGTLAVNLLGSFVLGVLAGAAVDGGWLALLGIGFCGAYTTFSTLALELWSAFEDGRRREVVANAALSLALGLPAAYLGIWLAS